MKNLEEAYKNSQTEEVPDLWARIEEKLPEKKNGKTKKIISIPRGLGLAAAAMFLCVLVPTAMDMMNRADSKSTEKLSFDAAMDTAGAYVEDVEENTAATDGTPCEPENVVVSEETDFKYDAVCGTLDAGPMRDETVENGTSREEDELSGNASLQGNITSAPENTIWQATLTLQEIVRVDEYKVLILSAGDGTIYRAQIPVENSFSYVVGGEYDFTLEMQASEDWDYVVADIK